MATKKPPPVSPRARCFLHIDFIPEKVMWAGRNSLDCKFIGMLNREKGERRKGKRMREGEG